MDPPPRRSAELREPYRATLDAERILYLGDPAIARP